jgi:predicted component of type VI protein secretion system
VSDPKVTILPPKMPRKRTMDATNAAAKRAHERHQKALDELISQPSCPPFDEEVEALKDLQREIVSQCMPRDMQYKNYHFPIDRPKK